MDVQREDVRPHVTRNGIPKKGWSVKRHAVLVAETMRDQGKHVEVYRCPSCDEWHVGRQPRAVAMQRPRHIGRHSQEAQ